MDANQIWRNPVRLTSMWLTQINNQDGRGISAEVDIFEQQVKVPRPSLIIAFGEGGDVGSLALPVGRQRASSSSARLCCFASRFRGGRSKRKRRGCHASSPSVSAGASAAPGRFDACAPHRAGASRATAITILFGRPYGGETAEL